MDVVTYLTLPPSLSLPLSLSPLSLREEESLVDMFVVEMLVVMIHSLKMAHRDDKGLGELPPSKCM